MPLTKNIYAMASTQLSRTLRRSSICARLELHRSIMPYHLPQCRSVGSVSPAARKYSRDPQGIREHGGRSRHPTKAKAIVENLGEAESGTESISKLHLPHMDKWRAFFPLKRDTRKRVSLRNPESARLLAESLVPAGSKDKIIIDASPGPGQLTRALLDLPKDRIKKVIVVEHNDDYLQYLTPLEAADPRVTILPMHGQDWSTYRKISDMGLLNDAEVTDWNQLHPQLQFIMHIASGVDGEQLAAQLLRTVPDRQWLHRYGRVPMHFILTARMWERMKAPPSSMARCKVSVMAQGAAEMFEAIPFDSLQPYSDHFHPDRHNTYELKYGDLDIRRMGIPHMAASFIPMGRPIIEPGDLDFWDYVLRKLFVQKATPLEKCISALGPGAYNILPKLNDPEKPEDSVDLKKTPRSLNVEEWSRVVRVFKNWPFRPDDLGIGTIFMSSADQ